MGNFGPLWHFGTGQFLIGLVLYIWVAICLMTIAGKLGRDDGWISFIPIVNMWYICVLADRPGWWIILFFIPLLNVIMFIVVWWALAERMGKPGWLSLLFFIPVVNVIIPGVIAFA